MHGRAVDYWRCGVVGLELILEKTVGTRILAGRSLTRYQEFLRSSQSPPNVCALAMLQVDPDSRMTAAEALPYFQDMEELRAPRLMRNNSPAL